MIHIFYIPCPDEKTAKSITQTLLEKKLIVCGNILSPIQSLYTWKQKKVEETEVALILKTSINKSAQVMSLVEQLHPYECPCILQFNPVANKSFVDYTKKSLNETNLDES